MSSMQTRAAWLLGAALLLPVPAALHAQDKALAPTSASEQAKTAFRAAIYESQNLNPAVARAQIAAAASADPKFGLAQVYQTVIAQGLTAAEREARIAPVLGAMGNATPAEVLLALYWRETAAGRGAAAAPILAAASALVPDDPEIAYAYANTTQVGKPATEQAVLLRKFLERFPNHAAAHNQLAYTLWRAGDREGALAAVQQYAKHAPDHPNAHDSYADILLLLGRNEEAIPHVQREIELAPDWVVAHSKLGTIQLTRGNIKEARGHFVTALAKSTTPGERIESMHWQAATHVYARDARGAVQQLMRIVETAREANMTGAVALAYDRAAVIDAYMGNRNAVATHLNAASAAATNAAQKATYQAHSAIALSRIGKAAEARAAVTEFAAGNPDAEVLASLEALLALDRKDYAAAETALGKVAAIDPLAKALRAELMMRTGRKPDGQALRQEVLKASVKVDGNAPVDFIALLGRMRVEAL